MSDVLRNSRRFKIFNVIDNYDREGILIKPNYSLLYETGHSTYAFTGVANRSEIFSQATIFLVTTGKQH